MPAVEPERQKQFKNIGRHEEARRRRNETSVELRKAKKDDQLMKRRNVETALEDSPIGGEEVDLQSPDSQQAGKEHIPLTDCVSIMANVETETIARYVQAVTSIRKLLSKQRDPPIDDVIQAGAVPHLIKALTAQNEDVQFESAWALTNIVSGSSAQTRYVVERGFIPAVVPLLTSPYPRVVEQSVWAIGNIVGDSADMRQLVIDNGGLPPMTRLVTDDLLTATSDAHKTEFLRTLTWALSNFVRHRNPPATDEVVQLVLPIVARLIQHTDKQIVMDASWACSYITDGTNERIGMVLDTEGVLARLRDLLGSESVSMVAPALRAIGNIATGDDGQTQRVIDAGIVNNCLPRLLAQSDNTSLRKEATWLLSNVAAGTAKQIQTLFDQGMIPLMLDVLDKGDHKSQIEAAWAVANITQGGTPDQTIALISVGAVTPISKLLKSSHDAKLIKILLEAIHSFCVVAERLGELDKLCIQIEESGGLDAIEGLQEHENEDVYQAALTVIEKFFHDDEQENIPPTPNYLTTAAGDNEVTPAGGFNF